MNNTESILPALNEIDRVSVFFCSFIEMFRHSILVNSGYG